MDIIGYLLFQAIQIYIYIIFASVIISWLVAFGVLNLENPYARKFVALIQRAVDPVMEPVRRMLPSVGGIDFSPIVVIFGLIFLQRIVASVFFGQ